MNVEEIRKKVRSLCENAGLQFFFAVPNASEWAVTDCEHLRKIVSYHKELETLPLVKPTQRWIPVSERLPDIHNYSAEYLTTVKDAGIHILSFTECAGKHWWAYKGVIAWMPLPEEYEADTDNEKLN